MTVLRPLLLLLLLLAVAACGRDSGPEDTAETDTRGQTEGGTAEEIDAEALAGEAEPVLEIATELPAPATAVVASADNRLFVALRPNDDQTPSLVEINHNGEAVAWPDSSPPASGQAPHGIRALHIDDEGALWILDATPRLLRVDLMQNEYTREINLDSAFPGTDHRPDGLGVDAELGVAYLIDGGQPGLVVLDMYTDEVRRMLEGTKVLRYDRGDSDGRAHMVLSPDLRYLVWQPPGSDDIYRLETEVMQFTELPTAELLAMVEHFGSPGPVRALTMDPAGLLYVAVDEDGRPTIVRIDHFATPETISHEAALANISAMGATRGGELLISTSGNETEAPQLLRLLGAAR